MITGQLISIIIPCYNASLYLEETLRSIVSQQGVDFEIIIVNDGSIDNSEAIINKIDEKALIYLKQSNKGVSSARNLGFKSAKGNYIVFFDADDIMPPNFLSSRLQQIKQNNHLDFVSGEIQKFNKIGILHGYYRGVAEKACDDILLYNPEVITCPSNYLFRTDFLIKNNIPFNEKLSSTADRFFILQCAKVGRYECNPSLVKLNYRVSENSMSHKLTKNLVNDNELFYDELKAFNLIPTQIKNKSLFLKNYILSASYLKTGNITKALSYGILCSIKNPIMLLKKLISE